MFEVIRLGLVAGLPAAAALLSRLFARGRRSRGEASRLPGRPPDPSRRPAPAKSKRTPHRGALLRVLGPCLLLGALSALLFWRTPPNLDLFEDGHALFPLQVYLSGGLPYRDAVPPHGLLADGGLQWIASRVAGDSVARIQAVESAFRLLFWPSAFLAAFAASRRSGLSLAAVSLLYLVLPQAGFPRAIPALLALALALHAMRAGRRGLWLLAGAAAGAAALFAIEFGAYAAASGLAAALLSRGGRRANVGMFALGGAAVLLALLAAAAAVGALTALVAAHTEHLPALFPIYAFGLRTVLSSAGWGSPPKLLFVAGLFAAAATLGLLVARWPRPGAALRSLAPVCVFFLAAALSVVDRHHFEYPLVALPALVAPGLRELRRVEVRVRAAVLVAAGLFLIVTTRPLEVLAGALARLRPPEAAAGWVRLQDPPRAGGIFLRSEDARLVEAMRSFLADRGPGREETWADFTNAPALYYLFDRRPPVRFTDVPFFQPDASRAEVARTIAGDRRIAAVLVAGGGRIADRVDGIDNRVRAPEVWSAIRRCFEPDFERDGIEIWRRRAEGCGPDQEERRVRRRASRPSKR